MFKSQGDKGTSGAYGRTGESGIKGIKGAPKSTSEMPMLYLMSDFHILF